ncbi:hypothetical protein K6U06_05735 [Acidiferrimicrobium sp. IK]|uniref:hypothetical protein n=1 Tax=Acidiferrimicrobium sp. IK TaxID=2871700 RepID=UPI0021CB390F|nr:hypothetical protein [Acidiferrimicrobium sp. IK]MCU4183853.1 hypothetical protein [Acidiferrimicrobium sp. IK]
MVTTQTIGCPIDREPARREATPGYFQALSDLDEDEVRLALGHFRHWTVHRFGSDSDYLLDRLNARHGELHGLIEGCGWSEGVIVFAAGELFDTEVDCGDRWGLEPMSKLRRAQRWTVPFELHRHGTRVCSSTPQLNCDLLNLATHYGGVVVARAMAYSGEPGQQLAAWQADADGVSVIDITA